MRVHIVQQGDCLSSIAAQYGFADWKTIYDDDLNRDFRKMRPDPNVLFPGDKLNIPEIEPKFESGQTEAQHTFQLARRKTRLRLIVRDIAGVPLAGKRYRLVIEGAESDGLLSGDGALDETIPPLAEQGKLLVWAEEGFADTWTLKLGHLDPVEELTGIQARLNNLGYDCGPVDNVNGPRTQAAIGAFQKDHGLEADGIPGPKTQAAIQNEHVS